MHSTFSFPIHCTSPQVPLNSPKIIQTELGNYITYSEISFEGYDAFDRKDLIPSIIDLAPILNKKEDKKTLELIAKWTEKWGFLKANGENSISENFYGQRIGAFIDEVKKFYDLWTLYKSVANRDLETLKQIVKIIPNEDPGSNDTHTFYFFTNKFYVGHTEGKLDPQNPLESFQWAAIFYLTNEMDLYINQHELYSKQIRHKKTKTEDAFKLTPAIVYPHLLDAVYMQMYILLTENEKKICDTCNEPFIPTRKDKKYCSNTCYLTAKSRRYRDPNKISLDPK